MNTHDSVAEPLNDSALQFIRDCSRQPIQAAAFQLRFEKFLRDQEDEETLQAWLAKAGYRDAISVADLAAALEHFQVNCIDYWSGHYTLTAGNSHAGELLIDGDNVSLNGLGIDGYHYDRDQLAWKTSGIGASEGTLAFSAIGGAQRSGFSEGYFAKRVTGTVRQATAEAAAPAAISGVTAGLSFSNAAATSERHLLSATADAGTYATLDQWNDDYVLKIRPAGATEPVTQGSLSLLLFNDIGDIVFNGQQFTGTDYSASGDTVKNGKRRENTLAWDDTAGPTGTKGEIAFSTFRGVKKLRGRYSKNGQDFAVEGESAKDAEKFSLVDIFVITGTVVAIVMLVGLFPVLKKGAKKLHLEWKELTGKASPEEMIELGQLQGELPNDAGKLQQTTERINEQNVLETKVPTNEAEVSGQQVAIQMKAEIGDIIEADFLRNKAGAEARIEAESKEVVALNKLLDDLKDHPEKVLELRVEERLAEKKRAVEGARKEFKSAEEAIKNHREHERKKLEMSQRQFEVL